MAQLTYPPKPWTKNQIAELVPGIYFYYSVSLQKWIPLTPKGIVDEDLVAGDVSIEDQLQGQINEIAYQIIERGRLWKLGETPTNVSDNDIYYHIGKSKLYSYHAASDTWVQII